SEAVDVNSSGQVVGFCSGPSGMRAFLWTSGGSMRDLGTLPGGRTSRALGINDEGRVVGTANGPAGLSAFVWTEGGGMEDLNGRIPPMESGVALEGGQGIGELGQIVVLTGSGDHG